MSKTPSTSSARIPVSVNIRITRNGRLVASKNTPAPVQEKKQDEQHKLALESN